MFSKCLNMKWQFSVFTFLLSFVFLLGCNQSSPKENPVKEFAPIPIILDTDANNEIDDQHAIAYMLFNSPLFEVKGITVNETYGGDELSKHVEEAKRVVGLCNWEGKVPVIPGASGSYHEIVETLAQDNFDGYEAVNFIIEKAREATGRKLVLVPIGKLTNIALALAKAPDIAKKVKVVWLGSNWPESGEYNLENDTSSISPLLENSDLELEILPARYTASTGTAAVTVHVEDIRMTMAGLGPKVEPVAGRHGGAFTCFGDYSIELFVKYAEEIRPLFDICTLAVLKNPTWAEKVYTKGISFDGENWDKEGDMERGIIFWENFNKKAIIGDFYATMRNASSQ